MTRGKTEVGGRNGNASLVVGAAQLALGVSLLRYLTGIQVRNQD